MSNVVFGCQALLGVNKGGHLKPDADGYYTVVLGALDFENSYGAVYPERSAIEILAASSSFMRRVKAGYCRGEYGHPKRIPGMDRNMWLHRIMVIEETRISHHISEVWVDKESVVHEGKKVVAIMGKIKPCGPYGPALEASLQNPKENVAFSIRSITDDEYVQGRLYKHIVDIAGWDFVVEPGLSVANKYQCPSLEGLDVADQISIAPSELKRVVLSSRGLGLESNGRLEELVSNLNNRYSHQVMDRRPPSATWH